MRKMTKEELEEKFGSFKEVNGLFEQTPSGVVFNQFGQTVCPNCEKVTGNKVGLCSDCQAEK